MKSFFKKDQFLVGGVLALGLMCTLGLMWGTAGEIKRQEQAAFLDESNHVRDSIADQLRAAVESLHNMTALFTVSSSEVDSDGFRMIAETTLAQQRAVKYLSFARWVPESRKQAFEEKNWRASGVAQFRIHSKSANAVQPKYYLPVVFLEPLTPKSISYLGFDLWSEPQVQNDIRSAIDSGETVVSEAVLDPALSGFTLIKAVYTGKIFPQTEEQRRKSVFGILRVFLKSRELMASLKADENFLFQLKTKGSRILAEKKSAVTAGLLDLKLSADLPLNVAQIPYRLHLEKVVPFTAPRAGIYLMVFLLGASISVLFAYRISVFLTAQREILSRQFEIERKVEEKTKALQQSEVLLRQVINSNPNVIFAQAKDQGILFANQTFFEVFGKDEAQVYGRAPQFSLPGQKFERGSWEEQIILENGSSKWFETHRVEIEIENQGLCSLVVAVDITQRKLANAVIADQRAKMIASAKLSALGEMAGGVAHEINTPLTTIQLCSDLIGSELKRPDLDRKLLERQNLVIARTTERIGKIVSGLRTFSKDGSRDEMTNFCLVQAIEGTLALCREKFRNSGIELDWQPSDSVEIQGREVQISQVILNLLNNSFDAVQETEKPRVRIRLTKINGLAQISIEDNGYGISEEAKERLFHPFFTTKESGKGTGLGLSISKGIVEIHSGQLRLDTTAEQTRFVIELPCAAELDFQKSKEA